MYIFIDEAGGFQVTSRRNQVSCVAALLVPESLLVKLFRRFVASWDPAGSEDLPLVGRRRPFYAISLKRKIRHPALAANLEAARTHIFA